MHYGEPKVTESVNSYKWLNAPHIVDARRLASIVREHGHPCRVIDGGKKLQVATSVQKCVRKWRGEGNWYWTWEITYIDAVEATVTAFLGY